MSLRRLVGQRSLGQRSRSASDGHRNLVNSIAPDLQNLHKTVHGRATNWLGFQGHGFKGQGHRNVFRRRHTDRLLSILSCIRKLHINLISNLFSFLLRARRHTQTHRRTDKRTKYLLRIFFFRLYPCIPVRTIAHISMPLRGRKS